MSSTHDKQDKSGSAGVRAASGTTMTAGRRALLCVAWVLVSALAAFVLERAAVGVHLLASASPFHGLFIWSVLLCVGVLVVLRDRAADAPEIHFLLLVLIIGGMMVVTQAANYTSWDQQIHYQRGLQLSYLGDTVYTRADEAIMLSTGETDLLFEWKDISERMQELDLSGQETVPDGQVAGYKGYSVSTIPSFVAYIPFAVGLALARLLGLSFMGRYLLGKFFILLFYAFIAFFGLRQLKTGKMILIVLALLPTALLLATNYSYDYWMNSLAIYWVGYVVGQLQRPEQAIRVPGLVLASIAAFCACLPRQIYFPILVLFFLLPKKRFTAVWLCWLMRTVVAVEMLVLVASFAVPFLSSGGNQTDTRGGSDVNSVSQVSQVSSSPFSFAGTLLSYMARYLSPGASGDYTVHLGYLEYPSVWTRFFAFALLLVVTLGGKFGDKPMQRSWATRILCVLATLACVILIEASMYVMFTSVGSNTIAGVQGRYLLPLLVPFLLTVGPTGLLRQDAQKAFNIVVLACSAALALYCWFDVYIGSIVL